jgi:hypothetical protein
MNINGPPGGRARRLGAVTAAVSVLAFSGCEDVSISVAEVDSVEVTPDPVTLVEGSSVTARATPRARGGAVLEGRTVTWSSDDPDIASISDEGVLEGLGVGSTRVRAVADGVKGSAAVEVTEAPRIELGETSVVVSAHAGQPQEVTVEISVENEGGGELSGLEAGVEMEDAPDAEWLAATLRDSTAPTVLTISLRPRDLEPGTHRGRASIRSSIAPNSPQTVRVRLEVGEPLDDDDGPPEDDDVGQERVQVASGQGATATATLGTSPTAGNLLVAVLWHRHDWETPVLSSEREWERVALHVEGASEVGNRYRKGLAIWVRHAGKDEPRTLSGGWEELDPDQGRETFLVVLELSGYGEFLGATPVQSSGASATDRITFTLTQPGAVVGIAGSRGDPGTTATWTDLHSTHRIRHTETSDIWSVVQSALGRIDDVPWEGSVALGEEVPTLAVLLRFDVR